MIESMNHVSFTVSDLSISISFYRDILGLKLISLAERDSTFSEKVTGIKGAKLNIAYFKAFNCAVELIQYLQPKGKRIDTATNNVGSAHVCFIVNDFAMMVARLKEYGVEFVSEDNCIVPAGPNKGRGVAYFHDPDRNTIEVISSSKLE